MSYRTICTVSVDDKVPDVLEGAIVCARHWNAHLDAWCVIDEDVPLGMSVYSSAVLTMNLEPARARSDRAAAKTAERLRREEIQWTARSVAASHGEAVRTIEANACLSDIAILSSPLDVETHQRNEAVFDGLLFDARLPVLVIGVNAEPAFDRVVVGCDGSPASLCAIRAALPILTRASEVHLVEVRTSAAPPDDDQTPAAKAAAVFLSRHGVSVDVSYTPQSKGSVADKLHAEALERKADLIVMGAYGRSRIREMVLGGTTRSMLSTVEVPLLVAH